MSVATQTTSMSAPVVYDMAGDVSAVHGLLYTSTSTEMALGTAAAAAKSGSKPKSKAATTTAAAAPHAAASCDASTRAVTAVMDDILHTYTGVPTWAVFLQVQKEGAGLRQQLHSGAAFEHAAVQPVISPYLIEWTRKLRALQAGRICAVGSTSPTLASSAGKKASGRKKSSGISINTSNSNHNNGGVSGGSSQGKRIPRPGTADVSTAAVEKELELMEAEGSAESGSEDGLLPLWDDVEPTSRCGPAVLHSLRSAVRTYYKALLHLVTLAESFVGRWGHLSSSELKGLQSAMAREKATHVPASFLCSAFTELNASEERLGNAVGELAKCDRMEVLRLNRNPGLTELHTLPPRCRVAVISGCRLHSFLSAAPPTATYTALTTLGLAYNQLRHVKFLSLLPALAVLDASFNYITDVEAVVRDVAAHGTVSDVTFHGNPISLLDTYRHTIIRGCVCLDKLDRVAITREERTLSFQKLQLPHDQNEDANDTSAATTSGVEHGAAEAMTTHGRKVGHRKSATGKLALPAVTSNNINSNSCNNNRLPGDGGHDAAERNTSRPRRASARRQSATSQVTLSPAAIHDSTSLLPSAVQDEVALRTTVAAAVELLVLRGLSSFEPTVQTHTVEELLPSSTFVYQLAGVEPQGGASNSGEGAHALHPSTTTPGGSAVQSPLATPSPPPHGFGSRKGRGNTANGAAGGGGSAASVSPSAETGGERLGTSPGLRGNAVSGGGGNTTSGGKRVAAAPPLYEVTSHICIEGCWAGEGARDDDASANANLHQSGLFNEAPLPFLLHSRATAAAPARDGVRVDFSVALAGPQPTSPQRGGNNNNSSNSSGRGGGGGGGNGGARRGSSASVAKLRKKAGTSGGIAVPSTAPASGASGLHGSATAAALNSAANLRDPLVLSGASVDGVAGRHNSLSDAGVYAAQLALTPDLVAALQRPLLLHVTVEDTFRFIESPALKAVTEAGPAAAAAGMARGTSANRGTGSSNSPGGRSTRDGNGNSSASPATSFATSPLPEAVLLSALALGPKEKKKEPAEHVEEAEVESHRRVIGVLRLNPFDLFCSAAGGAPSEVAVLSPPPTAATTMTNSDDASVPSRRAAPATGAFPSLSPAAPNSASSAAVTNGAGPALPASRVLFLHDTVMETDQQAIQAMQRELQQRQRQLHETLTAYNTLLEQCVELTTEGRGGMGDGADAAGADPAVPSIAMEVAGVPNGSGSGVPGQISPRQGKRVVPSPPATPFNPPPPLPNSAANVTAAAAAAAAAAGTTPLPSKPPSRSSRVSMSPQPNAHLLHLHSSLKEQQGSVVRQAVRIVALQSRLRELASATLSADARLSVGRGPPPLPTTSVEADLDALRYRREAPATRKGRPQPQKGARR